MPLETGDYIADLVQSNPPGTDPQSQGDDHIRLIKKTVQQSFPLVAGPVSIADTDFLSRNVDETLPSYWGLDGLDINGNGIDLTGGLYCYGSGVGVLVADDVPRYSFYVGEPSSPFGHYYAQWHETNHDITWRYSNGTAQDPALLVEWTRADLSEQALVNTVPVRGITPVGVADFTRKDYVDQGDTDTLAAANAYTDTEIGNIGTGGVIGGLLFQGNLEAVGAGETAITFPTPFSATPQVVACGVVPAASSNNDDPLHITAGTVTTTGFTVSTPNATVIDACSWIAFGPA